ncbi:chitin-binding domain protein cbd-1-like [Macrosteles quadrilineatus]|uniref:chitin-binding domain protein cbd-1-like n=1 Tax=Macrosteles quadrilineatus TaxID=74068 RepID=UPI0023E1CBE6|nr:chitin-binding domain protein cbd-1-like [Macrosteles quadrilineatus]
MIFILLSFIFLGLQGLEGGPPKKCPVGEYFSDPDDCRVFYQCDHGRPVRKRCSPGTVFNPVSWVCDWPYNVDCGVKPESTTRTQEKYTTTRRPISENQCKDGFDYADPVKCPSLIYYQCIGKKKILQTCKNHLVFNPDTCLCDKPTNIKCQVEPGVCRGKLVL